MPDWKWIDESVEIAGEVFHVKKPVNRGELDAFSGVVMASADVYGLLKTAMSAFSSGQAVYEGCLENAESLCRGFRSAETRLMSVVSDVGLFFEPAIKPEKLGRDVKIMLSFAIDAAKRLNALDVAARKANAVEPAPIPEVVKA